MELFLLLIIAVAGVWLFVHTRRQKAEQEAERAEDLRKVKSTVSEDVTRLGEELAELDLEVGVHPLDTAGRQDYQRALDSYDQAKGALDAVREPGEIRGVTEALEDGRYAAACVRARVNSEPIPTRRPPCFFNPQHGPSTDDVDWAPPGGQPRPVPMCAADAERVRAGAEPATRQVLVGAQRRPYYDAGPAYAPYSAGYFGGFAASGLLPGILIGSMLGGGFGGGWDGAEGGGGDAGGDFGGGAGDSGDGGGFDGGGDYAGGDFGGGGDFGAGGDFGGGFGGDF
jgi:hypothetical protein